MSSLEKFAIDLSSPYWWASVVVVGLVVNIVSAYLKSPLDRIFGSVSHRWKAKTERQKEELESDATLLANNLPLLDIEIGLQTRDLVLSLVFFVLSVGLGFFVFITGPHSVSRSLPLFLMSIAAGLCSLLSYILSNALALRTIGRLEVVRLARSRLRVPT